MVQVLLNTHIGKLASLRALTVDGIVGPATIRAIEAFQSKVVRMKRPDGRVDPAGRTMAKLNLAVQVGSSAGLNITGKPLPAKAKKVLSEILRHAGLSKARVTSVQRSPAEQARVMYDNIKSKGVAYNYKLYGSNGDKIIKVYEQNSGKTKARVVALMEAMIKQVGPSKVSKHCSTSHYVFDVAPSSIVNKKKMIDAINSHKAVSRLLKPPSDPAFHIEIPKNSPHI